METETVDEGRRVTSLLTEEQMESLTFALSAADRLVKDEDESRLLEFICNDFAAGCAELLFEED